VLQQIERVETLRLLVDFMKYTWQLEMPSVVFSITGSGTDYIAPALLQRACGAVSRLEEFMM
jgi:hypothetical protein